MGERHDHRAVDSLLRGTVYARRVARLTRPRTHEVGQHEGRQRHIHGDVDGDQAERRIGEPQRLDDLPEVDRAEADRDYQTGDEEDVQGSRNGRLPTHQFIGRWQPEQQEQEQQDVRD